MAFRLSDRDRAASQAAAAIRQANRAQKDYENQAAQAQANLSQAQSRPMGGLESVLAGIGEKFNDWGSTIGNIGRTVIGGVSEPFRKAETDRINSDDSARRNEIAKRYGFSSYSEAANSGRASQDFWNEIKNTSDETKQKIADKTERSNNAIGNVRDIDLNNAKGQSLSAIGDLLQILGPAGNVLGGVAEGVGNSYKATAGGTDADVWGGDNLGRTLGNAAIGGATAFIGDKVGGKLASKAPGNGLLSRAIHSNVGRGAIAGAAAGATGGGLGAALNGGDVIGGALQGAQGGALAGGTMAGAMGLIGSGVDRLNRKYGSTPQAQDTPTTKPIVDEVAEQYVKKPATIETALQEAQTPTRRQIDVQYDGSNNGNVAVNRQRRNTYGLPDRSGSTLDGILGPNNKLQLPNAQRPANPYAKMTDIDVLNDISPSESGVAYKNLADAIQRGDFLGDDPKGVMAFLKEELPKETYDNIQNAIQERVDLDNMWAGEAYGVSKGDLPYLNRDEYYRDTIGRLGNKGNGNLRAEDVPESMYNRLRNSAGKNSLGGNMTDNESILRELFGNAAEGKDKYELYDMYQQVAEAPGPRAYNMDDITAAVTNSEYNNNLGDQALNAIVAPFRQEAQPTSRQIGVQGAPSIADSIDVSSPNRGQLIQDVMPAQRRQAQPQVQAQAPQEAPTQRVRRAADTSGIKVNPNLDPADVARLERQLTVSRQKQGAALLEQYGTLDAPVRRAIGSPEDVLATLYDDYGLRTPADVQYAANHVTGRDGVVSKMTRELAASANNVDTTITRDWLQELMDTNGLLDDEQKTVTKQIAGALKRANTNSDGATTLDIMKQLEKQSARYKGKDGTYHHATEAETRKGIILDLVHDELQDRLWDAAGDPKKVLTPNRITELKNMYKGNDTWTNFIDNKLANSRSGAELRSYMKPLVDGSKIVYGSKMSAGGFANNARRLATGGRPLQAGGQLIYDALVGSDKAKQTRADRYARDAAKAKAQLTGQDMPKGNGLIGAAKNIGQKAVNKAGKAADMLNNGTLTGSALGRFATMAGNRRIGQGEAQAVENRAALQDATQQMQDIQSNYDNAMAQAQQMYSQAQQAQDAVPDTLNRISVGMERALAAGDIDAYSQLAGLYKQAAQIYQLQNPTATQSGAKALSANQSKALAGLQQLQDLRGMQPGVRTALANSPLAGLVDITGGDDYSNQAKSLALTLGYLQSGANITPREAENIGRAYIPSAYDSEQVRQNKLSRAEQLLRNYLADTSALQ